MECEFYFSVLVQKYTPKTNYILTFLENCLQDDTNMVPGIKLRVENYQTQIFAKRVLHTLRPIQLALRPLQLALRPLQLASRPVWLSPIPPS